MDEPTLMSALKRQVHRDPQVPVAVWGKEAPSYAEAYSLAQVLMRYFEGKAGLRAGDAVLVSSPSTMGCFCAVAAVQACGAKAVLAPAGLPREALSAALRQESPCVALVADPGTCACVRQKLPGAPVFSMGSPDVDAPSMGYMADQAIGLVDEVFLKVGDADFDEARDVEVAFVGEDGGVLAAKGSQLAREGRAVAAAEGLREAMRARMARPFTTEEGMARAYAVLGAGATMELGA